eukprot:102012_1
MSPRIISPFLVTLLIWMQLVYVRIGHGTTLILKYPHLDNEQSLLRSSPSKTKETTYKPIAIQPIEDNVEAIKQSTQSKLKVNNAYSDVLDERDEERESFKNNHYVRPANHSLPTFNHILLYVAGLVVLVICCCVFCPSCWNYK